MQSWGWDRERHRKFYRCKEESGSRWLGLTTGLGSLIWGTECLYLKLGMDFSS